MSRASSSDEYVPKSGNKERQHSSNCASCGTESSSHSAQINHVDCIMCRFKTRYSGRDLPKLSKKQRVKSKKSTPHELDLNIERIKTSKSIHREPNVDPNAPFPHLQRRLLSEKVYHFYDREDTSTESTESGMGANNVTSLENDKLVIDLGDPNTNAENEDEVMPKLTLWLV